ncbi:MAG: gamma-glutamylcyclotransferase family protein [Solirubrobacteraceae bacterium]
MELEYLFSYGTLQNSVVQKEVFRKIIVGLKDYLVNYKLDNITLEDKEYPIIVFSNSNKDKVEGTLFELSKTELLGADIYETSAYKRIKVTLLSKKECWVYVNANQK